VDKILNTVGMRRCLRHDSGKIAAGAGLAAPGGLGGF